MAYDTNNILKGMDVTKPDGASEYGSILDNAMKEVKRCLANEFSVKTVSSFPYTVLETDSLLLLNGTGTVNMIQCSTVSSTSIRKEYTLIQVSGTGTIAAYSGDSVPVSTLTVGQMVKMIGVGGTTWYEDKSYKTESIYDGSAYRSASATPAANTVPVSDSAGKISRTWVNQGPKFSVYLSSAQINLTSGTFYKVTFQTKEYDDDSIFDNVTNYRLTPNLAGKYLFCGALALASQSGTFLGLSIKLYKNGSAYRALHENDEVNQIANVDSFPFSIIVEANGTTDYFEIYVRLSTGSGLWVIQDQNEYQC